MSAPQALSRHSDCRLPEPDLDFNVMPHETSGRFLDAALHRAPHLCRQPVARPLSPTSGTPSGVSDDEPPAESTESGGRWTCERPARPVQRPVTGRQTGQRTMAHTSRHKGTSRCLPGGRRGDAWAQRRITPLGGSAPVSNAENPSITFLGISSSDQVTTALATQVRTPSTEVRPSLLFASPTSAYTSCRSRNAPFAACSGRACSDRPRGS